jgi:hypothetical protein
MDVIEYLENMAQVVLNSKDYDCAVKNFNQFHGAFDALARCAVFSSDDEYNKALEIYLQLVEYGNATYDMNIQYDKDDLFV